MQGAVNGLKYRVQGIWGGMHAEAGGGAEDVGRAGRAVRGGCAARPCPTENAKQGMQASLVCRDLHS